MSDIATTDRFAFLLQFVTTTAIMLLFGLVSARVTPRGWLSSWTQAWKALWLAIFAVTIRFDVLLPASRVPLPIPLVQQALDLIYVIGKLAFFALLLEGAWLLARRPAPSRLVRGGIGVLLIGVATVIVGLASNVDALVQYQALVAVPLTAAAAALLLIRPRRPGEYGGVMVGAIFVTLAVLWLGYYNGLAADGALLPAFGRSVLIGELMRSNSVIDALLELLLGYGMVMVLSEDVGEEHDRRRRRQLAALTQSENRLSRIFDAALDGIITLDADFRILEGNGAAGAVLGVAPAQLIGEPFAQFLPVDMAATWRADWALEGEALPPSSRHRFRGRRRNGDTFPAEVTLAPIGPDREAGLVLVLRDETETERTAAEGERLRQRLAQSQRLETVGQLVSGVAHELNNPLAAILAFTEELKHSAIGTLEVNALTTIEQQTVRCRAIVRDLLRVARKREVRLQAIAPRALLERVVRGFEPAMVAGRVEIRLLLPPTLPDVIGDEGALEQILANLITNALQASPAGGYLVIEAAGGDDRLTITVEDEGSGIAPDVQARLFEPFFTTKPVGEGTGLGLSVSRGLVEQLGGTLAVENRQRPEHGARATVTLPLAKAGQIVVPPVAPAEVRGLGRRALVIDDEAPVRAAVRRYLERNGWRVDEAQDGRVALERITTVDGDAYSALICDLRMPNLSGIELHDLLAATHPDLLKRTVIMTGDVASLQVADFLARTWAPVIEKPFDLGLLGAALMQVAADHDTTLPSIPRP